MKKRSILVRIIVAVAFVAVCTLWLKELTQRRARYAADMFMGGLLQTVGYDGTRFELIGWPDATGKSAGPGWDVWYDSYYGFIDPPPTVYVDLFGRVRSANSDRLNALIALPEEERWKRQNEMVVSELDSRRKRAEERRKEKDEQSDPPNLHSPVAPGGGGR